MTRAHLTTPSGRGPGAAHGTDDVATDTARASRPDTGPGLTGATLLTLQRQAGNRAVTGLVLQRREGQRGGETADRAARLINMKGDHRAALKLYDFNWFDMKEDLAYSDHRDHIDAMIEMVRYRKQVVDELLRDALRGTWDRLASDTMRGVTGKRRKGLAPLRSATVEPMGTSGYTIAATATVAGDATTFALTAFAAGSTTPTSDYDISFTAVGLPQYEVDAVALFNERFRDGWGGRSSGVVFDTNVYSSGFMPEMVGGAWRKKDEWARGEDEDTDALAAAKLGKHQLQLAWSILPIRQYFDGEPEDWEDFGNEMVNDTFDTIEGILGPDAAMSAQTDLEAVLELVDELHEQTQERIGDRKDSMAADVKKRNPGMTEEDLDFNVTALAKDTLYEDTLGEIREILVSMQSLGRKLGATDSPDPGDIARYNELIVTWHRKQGEALVYANEAYFSGGPVKHVVLGMQGGAAIELSRQEQMQSLLMNIGYKLEHYHEHEEGHGSGRATYSTAKYGQRIGHLALNPDEEVDTRSGPKESARRWGKDVHLFDQLSEDEIAYLEDEIRVIHDIKKSDRFSMPVMQDEASAKVAERRDSSGPPPRDMLLSIAKKAVAPFYIDKWESGGGWGGAI